MTQSWRCWRKCAAPASKGCSCCSVAGRIADHEIDHERRVIPAVGAGENARIRAAPLVRRQHVIDPDPEQSGEFRVTEAATAAREGISEISPVGAVNGALDRQVEVSRNHESVPFRPWFSREPREIRAPTLRGWRQTAATPAIFGAQRLEAASDCRRGAHSKAESVPSGFQSRTDGFWPPLLQACSGSASSRTANG